MADPPKASLEDTASNALNAVMFWLLVAVLAVAIVFVLVTRVELATSPMNFLHDSWQYVLVSALFVALAGRSLVNAVRRLRRRA